VIGSPSINHPGVGRGNRNNIMIGRKNREFGVNTCHSREQRILIDRATYLMNRRWIGLMFEQIKKMLTLLWSKHHGMILIILNVERQSEHDEPNVHQVV
jgi:hypothetical protein